MFYVNVCVCVLFWVNVSVSVRGNVSKTAACKSNDTVRFFGEITKKRRRRRRTIAYKESKIGRNKHSYEATEKKREICVCSVDN